ncbi:MAG TPA: L,D-transpeptidase [Candidatus Saccharimonadales bacterium]|nr:L,D-transpeptidase [Candidatus Saccharimonadales bacterium]
MKSSSLQGKTVRPGLMAYSFYRSDRHPPARRALARPKYKFRHKSLFMSLLIVGAVAFGCVIAARAFQSYQQNSSSPAAQAVADGPKQCAANSFDKQLIVSVSERHMWACQLHKVVYDTPVVTGMEFLPADLTPRGTYHIYAKQTDTTLTGTDSTGSWSDTVHYWMPFLQNQNGTYGFHDATWRANSDFGNIDPNSKNASHGCVELPLNASHWIYDWAPVGTTVTVRD